MKIEVHRRIKIPEGWSTCEEIEKVVVPGDIVEIKFGKNTSHFVLNIRKGWCVHVRPLDSEGENNGVDMMVVKDASDLAQEAGLRPCRINNFEEFSMSKNLKPRSLKDCLNLARANLANGPITLPASDITPVFHNNHLAQEFCLYWKYKTSQSSSSSLLQLLVSD